MIRGVQIIIINNNLELLIAKRAPLRKDGSPRIGANRWNFIGGKIDGDEKPIETALRELKEEAGLDINTLFYLSEKLNPWDLDYDPFYAYLYAGFVEGDIKIILNEEHTEYKFIPIEDINKYNFLGYEKEEIEKDLKYLFNKFENKE